MTRIAIGVAACVLVAAALSGRSAWGGPGGAPPDKVKPRVWGGEHVRLEVTDKGARIEYDCGNGTIDQPMALDAKGRFSVRGRHVIEHGGPVRDELPTRAARYTGTVTGKRMHLTVTFEGEEEPFGTFSLAEGEDVPLTKCK